MEFDNNLSNYINLWRVWIKMNQLHVKFINDWYFDDDIMKKLPWSGTSIKSYILTCDAQYDMQ